MGQASTPNISARSVVASIALYNLGVQIFDPSSTLQNHRTNTFEITHPVSTRIGIWRIDQAVAAGSENALIYKTMVLTGLRVNELRTLTAGCLSFGDVPFVRLEAKHEKNRAGSSVPLRSDLAAELQEWTAGRQSSDSVFYVSTSLVKIMDLDLAAAGIPKRDSNGCVVHVHALRHSFGTHLSLSGVSPRVAQAAMRHSSLALTMGTYTDARLLDTAGAVESIGLLRTVAPNVALAQVDSGPLGSSPDQSHSLEGRAQKRKKPRKSNGNAGLPMCPGLELNQQGVAPTTTSTLRVCQFRHLG